MLSSKSTQLLGYTLEPVLWREMSL